MRNYKPKEQLGVIIYFDMRPALERLSMVERGELLVAARDKAKYYLERARQQAMQNGVDPLK